MSDLTITRDALRSGVLLDYVRRNMPPGTFVRSDAEIEADLDRTLADHDGGDLWLFGYGSLMWNPALEFVERRTATALGWHRRFCLWMHAGRGSPEQPGLMLALDQGGQLLLLRANREKFDLLDQRKLTKEETWAHLAVVDEGIIVRELHALTAFRWPDGNQPKP